MTSREVLPAQGMMALLHLALLVATADPPAALELLAVVVVLVAVAAVAVASLCIGKE